MYAIVTGGNAGMGLAAAKELCRRDFDVTISARSELKAQEAIDTIRREVPNAKISVLPMELKDLSSVTSFAQAYLASGKPLNLLINNAGIMTTPFEITKDGFEAQFQVNHLGHFLLTHHLLPLLRTSANDTSSPSRVINLSSRAHLRWSGSLTGDTLDIVRSVTQETYDGWKFYGLSKLANILFTRSLTSYFPPSESNHVLFFSLHPGLVDTNLLSVVPDLAKHAIPIDDGIKTTLFLATADPAELVNGAYYFECALAQGPSAISNEAQSTEDAEALWQKSLTYVGLAPEQYGCL